MPTVLPPPIASLFEGIYWLRDGSTGSSGEFVERLLFPSLMPSDRTGPFPDRIRCCLPRDNKIPVDALVRAISKVVQERGHPSPEWFAGILVALVAVARTRCRGASAVDIFEQLLSTAARTTAWHYRVLDRQLSGPATFMSSHSVGPFWFGPLNQTEIASRIAPTCVGKPERVADEWTGRYVMRFQLDITAMWPIAAWTHMLGPNGMVEAIREDEQWLSALNAVGQDYFARLHVLIENSALATLRRMIALCAVHGSDSLDARWFQGSEVESRFTVFSALGDNAPFVGNSRVPLSWIAEVGRTFTPLDDAARREFRDAMQARIASMEAVYNEQIQKYKAAQLHPLVSRYMDRLGSAFAHATKRSISAAFLDFVIALEILFSAKEGTTDVVSGRAATLIALAEAPIASTVAPQYAVAVKELKRLYGVRSSYVHRGIEVPAEDLASLRGIVNQLTPVVLRWNDRAAPEDEQTHENWLRLIDYARATVEMNRSVASTDLYSMGVIEAMPGNGGLRLAADPAQGGVVGETPVKDNG